MKNWKFFAWIAMMLFQLAGAAYHFWYVYQGQGPNQGMKGIIAMMFVVGALNSGIFATYNRPSRQKS